MDVESIALTANQRTRVVKPGRFFMIVEAGGPLDVSFERNGQVLNEVARAIEAGYARFPGNWQNPQEGLFTAVVLNSPTNQTVRIGVSDTAADYRRVVGVVQLQQPNDGTATADQTVSSSSIAIAAANTSRRLIHIQNVSGSGNVRVALGTTATATTGSQLGPGQSVTFESTAAVNAIREGASDVDVSVTEELRT